MPRILVAEDSPVDRTLVRALLENQDEVEVDSLVFAEDGEQALQAMASQLPDVVVTDLVMPGMTGIELVETIAERYPLVPVIVMTSQGSEETAVEALRKGAASYVPKTKLAGLLAETLDSVLAAAVRQSSRARLMRVMVESHLSFELGNDRALFRPLLQYLQDTMADFGLFDDAECMRICVAVEEALNNAAEHGNLELDSALREKDFAQYVRLMKTRCGQDGFRQRRIHFQAHFTTDEAVFDIRDEGKGFDQAAVPGVETVNELAMASGRGLTLMHAFMDKVEFNDAGNRVRLKKRSRPTAATA